MASQTEILKRDPALHEGEVSAFLERSLPAAVRPGRYRWAYLDNPAGPAELWVAYDKGRVIGTSVGFPRSVCVEGERRLMLLLSDFAVAPEHRTLGPALKLLRATLDSIETSRYAFALDFPSESMYAIYRRLGFSELGRQIRCTLLVSTRQIARRANLPAPLARVAAAVGDTILAGSRYRFRSLGKLARELHGPQFDPRYEAAAASLSARASVYIHRDEGYLRWRYQSGFRGGSRVVTVTHRSDLLGYAVTQPNPADRTLQLMELVCEPRAEIASALIDGAVAEAKRQNMVAIQASCMEHSPWHRALNQFGFANRETSLGPVVFVPRGAEGQSIVTDAQQWWSSDGDRDS